MFHYAPFRNESCPTWAEAESRFVYGAWNVYRVDAGNPHFGPGTYCATTKAIPLLNLLATATLASRAQGGGSSVWSVFNAWYLLGERGGSWLLHPPKPLVSVRIVQAPTPFAII